MKKKIVIAGIILALSSLTFAGTGVSKESQTNVVGMKSRYFNTFYEMWANDYSTFNQILLQPVLGATPSINTVSLGFMEWQMSPTTNQFAIYSGLNQKGQLISEWLSPQNPAVGGSIDPEYYAWTYAKFQNPGVNMLLSFGGYTYGGIWDQLANANQSQIESLAQLLVTTCTTNYPVYNSWTWFNQTAATQVGTVTLNGIDFDFEPTTGGTTGVTEVITQAQINALSSLIADIHALNENLMITIDGRSCSADGPGLTSSMGPNGTAPATAGELVPLLQSPVMADVAYVNVMGYDSGSTYYDQTGYQQSLANYAHYIGASKTVAGLSACSQYLGITDSISTLETKANYISSYGYAGASFWTLGPDLIAVAQSTPMSTYTTDIANNL
ncbi:MAG: glycosyl hydrolase family 18 protein [Fusobacteria bacterium]|nr:glycosyl hydrolase family 18 protein [Fusobacteriota bacterium]